MMNIWLVGLGGALGCMARYTLANLALGVGLVSPFATLGINIAGSLLMGILAGFTQDKGLGPVVLVVGTGFLGGFTTFSAFALDAIGLMERGNWGLSAAYVAISVGASLLALASGLQIGRFFA